MPRSLTCACPCLSLSHCPSVLCKLTLFSFASPSTLTFHFSFSLCPRFEPFSGPTKQRNKENRSCSLSLNWIPWVDPLLVPPRMHVLALSLAVSTNSSAYCHTCWQGLQTSPLLPTSPPHPHLLVSPYLPPP